MYVWSPRKRYTWYSGDMHRTHGGHNAAAQHGKPRGGKRKKPAHAEYEGVLHLTARGIGYVDVPELTEDIEVAPEALNTGLHRDTVRVHMRPGKVRGRLSGEVVEILTRATTRFVGTVEEEEGFMFVRPDDHRCYVDFILARGEARPELVGTKVAVELVRWSTPAKNPLVRIVEVLGPKGEHETEMRSLVAAQGFDWTFPSEVEARANALEAEKDARFAREALTRRDMRGTPTFTIDPADAKDFDDAISVTRMPSGHIELGVHIADVSAYVERDDVIDKEAQKRGTSIYLVDRTIPMLPEALSNDLCSLMPHVERLAFSIVFDMSEDGTVHDRWIGETIIRSDRRFSYEEAQEVLTRGTGDHLEELRIADTIARALRTERFKNGSIGFETDEIKFELDAAGKPVRAFRKVRLDTMLMIEDLMLLANREIATWVAGRNEKAPKEARVFVWRIHDSPKPERIEELALLTDALGFTLEHHKGETTARALNTLFAEIEGKPEQSMIETAAIRSMAKAVYSMKNIGHFGLAFNYYTHFTSPIRRYPDVMVHRIVKAHLAGTPPTSREYAWYERMAAQSSEREVAAMEAERDSIKLKQVEYMQEHIGETFTGIVTGINEWGIFVQEKETMAEGLLRTSSLRDDYYELKDHGFRLVGTRKGRTLSLADTIEVRLKAVDLERKTLDWELVA